MEITMDELLSGKATKIKNNNYFSTAAYVEPFIERMSEYTDDFRIQVKLPDQITLNEEGGINKEDITYNRVYIQAVLPEIYNIGGNDHNDVIGMVYGLDVRKPVAKIFKGALNGACTNLCVFNPEVMQCQEIKPESAINFKFVSQVMDMTDGHRIMLEKLANTEFKTDIENVQQELGRWVRNTIHCSYDNGYNKVKLAASTAIDAYKLLFETKESPYYIGLDNETSMFNVYNAFTQINTDNRKKDVFNEFEKSLLVQDILTL